MPDRVITRFLPDARTYIRDHLVMAVLATVAVMAVLYLLGNQDIWVAFIAAPAAIAVRGFYLQSEEMAVIWELTDRTLTGPGERRVLLSDITKVRTLGSAAQVVARNGDKHLIKYLANPRDVADQIEGARMS